VENRQIQDVIRNIENNIAKCSILKGVLEAKKAGYSIDYNRYHDKGYSHEEVRIGAELVDLYLKLKDHIYNVK